MSSFARQQKGGERKFLLLLLVAEVAEGGEGDFFRSGPRPIMGSRPTPARVFVGKPRLPPKDARPPRACLYNVLFPDVQSEPRRISSWDWGCGPSPACPSVSRWLDLTLDGAREVSREGEGDLGSKWLSRLRGGRWLAMDPAARVRDVMTNRPLRLHADRRDEGVLRGGVGVGGSFLAEAVSRRQQNSPGCLHSRRGGGRRGVGGRGAHQEIGCALLLLVPVEKWTYARIGALLASACLLLSLSLTLSPHISLSLMKARGKVAPFRALLLTLPPLENRESGPRSYITSAQWGGLFARERFE